MGFWDIFALVCILVFSFIIVKLMGQKYPVGFGILAIIILGFLIKTCRDIDREEAEQQKRVNEINQMIQEEKQRLEERKRERLKEISLEEYIKELDEKK